ncbi:MAG: hypothetical protein FWF50_00345, partial [Defluviitaleaceae bacterium]|nr:hypothetical protein [Defluviitaleaceae bacterium]
MKFLKNISLAGILTALFAVVFTTNAYSNEVTIIKTSPQSNVFVGQNITLTAIVIPDHGQELVWWSGDGRATVVQDNQGRYIFNATQSGTIRVHVMEQLYNTSQYFDIEVMASNEPTIQSISLSGLTAPVAGQLPQNTINTNDSRIIQPNFVWQRQSGNDWNTFSGSFNSNTNYRLVLTLTTNHPSGFAVNVPVSVNTGTVSANQTNNLNAMSITRYITFPTTAVDNADINITGLTVPIAGALPVNANNVNTQQSGINVTNVVWERSQGGNWVNFQGNFGSNNAYRAILTITTNANAGFASNIIVAAPGGTITGNNSSGSAEITRIVTFPNTES